MEKELIIGKYTLESLTNGMYSSPLDMYREYIQNSVDSFDDIIESGIDIENKLHIDIRVNEADRSIVIRDNGTGIRSIEATSRLLDIGNSHKSHNLSRGFRGIGRLAGLSYCDKLTFRTSYQGECICTIIEFDAKLLKELLLPGSSDNVTVEEVISRIVTVKEQKEKISSRYFEVKLENVDSGSGLTDYDNVQDYLLQHAPIPFSKNFKWNRVVLGKTRLNGFSIPQYKISLNGNELVKPYTDSFVSDRIRKNTDEIQDIVVECFSIENELSAVLWYAQTNYYGTVIDNSTKGIRIRQGNILIGDKTSCNHLFKEERFNGWMLGELHILDKRIIANSRRDGFEKNKYYYSLVEQLRDWALDVSKSIRHLSYERSLTKAKKEIIESETLDEIDGFSDIYSDDSSYLEDFGESEMMNYGESEGLAETDYITKLENLLNKKKWQTKYTALNINEKLTIEQRKVLERVFDIITQEYSRKSADRFISTISKCF